MWQHAQGLHGSVQNGVSILRGEWNYITIPIQLIKYSGHKMNEAGDIKVPVYIKNDLTDLLSGQTLCPAADGKHQTNSKTLLVVLCLTMLFQDF
uniref:Uncharacterized protein n=1 Tax=Trichinella nativa TaxID=6335 RepID=A0A0V1KJA4_9BILA